MLMYTAELKLPMSQSLDEKRERVTHIIELLALLPCQNRRIGNAMQRGISGGQAKRTNIGIALVTSPRILFLDEPTSGLDSFTSNEVITELFSIAGIERPSCIQCCRLPSCRVLRSALAKYRCEPPSWPLVGDARPDHAQAIHSQHLAKIDQYHSFCASRLDMS